MKKWKLVLSHPYYNWDEQRNMMKEEIVLENLPKKIAISLMHKYNKLSMASLFMAEEMD